MKTITRSFLGIGTVCVLAITVVGFPGGAQTFKVVHNFGNLDNVTGFHPAAPLVQGSDGTLYGTTSEGENVLGVGGTVFRIQPDGSGFDILKYFTNYSEAWKPKGELVFSGATLYGTTEDNGGTVFKINVDGTGFAVLKQFQDSTTDGQYPSSGLTVSGSTLYGTTYSGGNFNRGTVFKLNVNGTGFQVLRHLTNSDGINPYAPLTVSGNTLYGTASYGGSNNCGTVFKLNTDGSVFTVLRYLALADGTSPSAGLLLVGSTLYGVASSGGNSGYGTVFKLNTDGSGFSVLKHFTTAMGGYTPSGRLVISGMNLYGVARTMYAPGGAVFKLSTNGEAFELLKQFSSPEDGLSPEAGLWLSGSTLYGTTWQGGSSDDVGTVFKLGTSGESFEVLKTFGFTKEGVNPEGGLSVAGTTLYGTTSMSAHNGRGTVFKVNLDGHDFTVLRSFQGPVDGDGALPTAGISYSSTALFGTTVAGGDSDYGSVFRMDADGSNFTVLKSFSTWSEGWTPHGGLLLHSNVLYGTTAEAGGGAGTVFSLNTNGSGFSVLKEFDGGMDGGAPEAALVASGETLCGTTAAGGSIGSGTLFKLNTDGSGFSVLKDFDGADGYYPRAGLLLSGQVLYGTTEAGGTPGYGTVFTVYTNGSGYRVLKEFDGSTEGSGPRSALILAGDMLYGTTYFGGSAELGTVFQLDRMGGNFSVLKEFLGPEGSHPSGPLVFSGSTLYGTTRNGGPLDAGVIFSISLLPTLRLQFTPTNTVVLAWPFPFTGFELEHSSSLTNATWTTVSQSAFLAGDEWQVVLSPTAANSFYRLHQP